MKQYKGYFIDLDGTMYRGTEKIEAASDFVKTLKDKGIPLLFLTNNSSRTQEQVARKLNSMDIPAIPDEIFTTSMATASYIKQEKENALVYAIGEEGLFDALEKADLTLSMEDCDYVVMGVDREITYEKLATACLNVRSGASFISTNGDVAIPTERGLLPGNGSLTSVVTVSTGIQPLVVGKPEAIIMDQALEKIGLSASETVMVGDNYHTDILAGMNAGLDTLMVFTGITTAEELQQYEIKPTFQIHSLEEWIPMI
ncbi:TIGR01457 family HAD-type hydrolase [Aquibacillus sp. 3ASR75-11]|uniref:Acid sugar phosphatase n=1 Tax=Terrihalobacillus insolitus TaxID=2950438 RepID=A0A9X4AK65_9BACI|nr:TIGR01457 family HAD-type hydrolase [Terrihalobacillus insolitus]MDC3412360.1 TIGR01457 family HAD-type hydrolase [Terrihalobacillus insolitus]MDC3422947.1 TIGR01457 family HAD-type hydrolase [Terrihalobacillus insolitus]